MLKVVGDVLFAWLSFDSGRRRQTRQTTMVRVNFILAIFYPFSQFCEIDIALLSLQKQPNTAPNLFQRGVEYGKYDQGVFKSM